MLHGNPNTKVKQLFHDIMSLKIINTGTEIHLGLLFLGGGGDFPVAFLDTIELIHPRQRNVGTGANSTQRAWLHSSPF